MKRNRQDIIAELVSELEPVKHPGRFSDQVVVWLGLSWVYTLSIVSATGPWRADALDQLTQSPQFFTETVLGLGAGIVLAYAAFSSAIPSPENPLRRAVLPIGVTIIWATSYVVGLWHPALDPSMLGKREVCWWDTLMYSVPPLILGLYLLRKFMALHPRISGALLGLACGALPGLAMQFACMYEPSHALSHHLAPALGIAALGALCAPWVLAQKLSS